MEEALDHLSEIAAAAALRPHALRKCTSSLTLIDP